MSSSAQLVNLKNASVYAKGPSGYSSSSLGGNGSGRDSRTHRTSDGSERVPVSSLSYAYSPNKYSSTYSGYGSATPERHSSSHGNTAYNVGGGASGGLRRTSSSGSYHAAPLSTAPSAPPLSVTTRVSILDQVTSALQSGTPRTSILSSYPSTRGVTGHGSSSAGTSNRTSYPASTVSHRSPVSSMVHSTYTSDYASSESQRPRRHKTFSSDDSDSPRHVPRNHSFSSAYSNDSGDLWSNSSPTYSSPRNGNPRPSSPTSTCSDATSLASHRSTSAPRRSSRRISTTPVYPEPTAPSAPPLPGHTRIERSSSGSLSLGPPRVPSYGSLHQIQAPAPVAAPRTIDGQAIVRLIRNSSPGQGCVGLSNLGNTCFMNSILQCLNAVPELVAEFQQQRLKWSDKAFVAPAYAHLVSQMWGSSYGSVVSPSAFLRSVSRHDSRWGSGRQQDSQEFLHSFLEALQSECNRITEKPKYLELQGKGSEQQQADEAESYARSWHDSIIDDVFGGQLQSTIECQVCKRQSHCFDPFLGLCVQMPNSKKGLSVASCLAGFVETEKLDNSESYKCEGCKKFQPATKRLQIYRYPRVLVLTLKRFSASTTFSRFSFTSKNSTSVAIDANTLDLSPFCNQSALKRFAGALPRPVYKLIGVSNHSGSLGGGHYTAQCRSVADGKWYDFNDSSVSRDSPPDNPSSSAYVLFYRLASTESSL